MIAPETEELIRKVSAETADAIANRMEHRLNVHYERTADLIKRAAEGYGATLESIDRRLDRLEKKVDEGFIDHAIVLKDHEKRLRILEEN